MEVLNICRRTLARYVKSGQIKIDATDNYKIKIKISDKISSDFTV